MPDPALFYLCSGLSAHCLCSLAQSHCTGHRSCLQAQKGGTVLAQGKQDNLSSLKGSWARMEAPKQRFLCCLSQFVLSRKFLPATELRSVTSSDHQLPPLSLLSPLSPSATDSSSQKTWTSPESPVTEGELLLLGGHTAGSSGDRRELSTP